MVEHPIATSLALVFGLMVVIGSAFAAAYIAFGIEPPNSSGAVNTVVSTVAGITWFGRKMHRRMGKRERLEFSVGVLLANILLMVGALVVPLLHSGVPPTLSNIDAAFMGGKGYLFEPVVLVPMGSALGLSFLLAYLLASFFPRKLSNDASA